MARPLNMVPPNMSPSSMAAPSMATPMHSGYSSANIGHPRDPRTSALETNQAMSALASLRSTHPSQYSRNPYGDPIQNREDVARAAGHTHGYSASGYGPTYYHGSSSAYSTSGGYHNRMGHTQEPSTSNLQSRPIHEFRGSDNARHQCSVCGKGFSRPSGLKVCLPTFLESVLMSIPAFICPEEGCRRAFSVKSNMRRHVRIVHQSTMYPEGSTDSSEDGDSGRDSREEE
ncbi:hypothetical protein F5880DRAFT_1564967 [Lentinula raphanica]|nr:hypothetical protein F5880DRAFT_1564967 [Lentinula raphanica]